MKVHRFVGTKEFFIILQLRYIGYIVRICTGLTNKHSTCYLLRVLAIMFSFSVINFYYAIEIDLSLVYRKKVISAFKLNEKIVGYSFPRKTMICLLQVKLSRGSHHIVYVGVLIVHDILCSKDVKCNIQRSDFKQCPFSYQNKNKYPWCFLSSLKNYKLVTLVESQLLFYAIHHIHVPHFFFM